MGNHYPTVKALAFKPDVLLTAANLDGAIIGMLRTAMHTAPPLGEDIMVVTSATDSKHKAHSLHYVSCAFDLRFTGIRAGGIVVEQSTEPHTITSLREVQKVSARFWAGRMRQLLSPDYDVIVEGNHIHVEWDPK